MSFKIKRNPISYLSLAAVIALFANAVSKIDLDSFQLIDAVNIIGLVFISSSFIWVLLKPNFIEIEDSNMFIYRDFILFVRKIDVQNIVALEEVVGLVTRTKIKLKDGSSIKFVSSSVKANDLEKLSAYIEGVKLR